MTVRLEIRKLTKEAFEPFGDVIETEGAEVRLINGGSTERFHALAQAQTGGGAAIVSIFRGQPRSFPYSLTMMERHPLGSQAFYPLQNRPWLVVVAQDVDGRPGSPEVFLASGAQGVNYRANIWHHPLMALDDVSDFLVVDREGEGNNLEEFDYPDPFEINWSK